MEAEIRSYRGTDEQAVVDLSLLAWQPVFDSMNQVLGRELFTRLHGPDWRVHQEQSVRGLLADDTMMVWVAEAGDRGVVGFVAAAEVDRDRKVGEVTILAVHPDAQGRGIGTALTDRATGWLADRGMKVAMVETGGDAGHAAARRTYTSAGYTLMPIARFFKAL